MSTPASHLEPKIKSQLNRAVTRGHKAGEHNLQIMLLSVESPSTPFVQVFFPLL